MNQGKLEDDEDPVEQVRRIRESIQREFKTLAAYCDYIRAEEAKDPKCNPALRRKKAKAKSTKPAARRRAAQPRATRKNMSASK